MELLPYISGFSNSLPVFLLSGVVHIPSPNKHFQRISQNWIIYIITDGIMQIMENENQYTLTAGDIMIFSPGKCHYGLLTNEHIDYYYIHFDWNCLQDITMTSEEYLQQKVGGHPFCPTPSSTVQNTFLLPKYFHPTHSDFEKIIRQMQHLTNFNSTNGLHQQSINDAPVNKDSITININCDGAAGTTLFYYVDKGIEYVEQPYQGIYKPTPALGNCITEMLASADNRPLMVTFQASVIETNHDSIIVKPVDGSLELDSADKFYISNEENLELQIGDFVEISYNGEIMESYPAQLGEVYKITVIEQTEANAMWDRIPMVRIDGKLYYDTGRESIMDARCGTMDGEITSTVDGTEIPTEDNQSNFGSGFGYQYGADDTIEIYMNDKLSLIHI